MTSKFFVGRDVVVILSRKIIIKQEGRGVAFVTDMRLSQKRSFDPLSVYRLPYVRSESAFLPLNGRGLLELYGCSRLGIVTIQEFFVCRPQAANTTQISAMTSSNQLVLGHPYERRLSLFEWYWPPAAAGEEKGRERGHLALRQRTSSPAPLIAEGISVCYPCS